MGTFIDAELHNSSKNLATANHGTAFQPYLPGQPQAFFMAKGSEIIVRNQQEFMNHKL